MAEEDLIDYEEEEQTEIVTEKSTAKKGHYVGLHTSNFRDFLLKPEILRATVDCGFEHPSEVQNDCIPQAVLNSDIICQAKAGMGKTAVFVLSTLQQITPVAGEVHCVVLCHTRELAYQIEREYQRLSKYLPDIKSRVFYGGVKVQGDIDAIKAEVPTVVVGTPGRIMDLCSPKRQALDLSKVKHFVLDECDHLLSEVDMRKTCQTIFKETPVDKQVMMFSATLPAEVKATARKFCNDSVVEVMVDNETDLKLHGLQQYFVKLDEAQKNRKLNNLLDDIQFNQVVIFVSKLPRAKELNKLLADCMFPSICITSDMRQEDRIAKFKAFKECEHRILVTTDLFGRGIDIEKVNVVINYDMPATSDQYLHRVGRAGRFGTKGFACSFVSTDEDQKVFDEVQSRLATVIPALPDQLDETSYM